MTRAERRQQWDHFIAAYKSSGQSVREWCAANGVNANRLWYWLRRTRSEDAEAKPTRWLPVEVTGLSGEGRQAGGLLVRVGKAGIEVRRGFDPELLVAVVRALSEAC
jgi:transposase-like protein